MIYSLPPVISFDGLLSKEESSRELNSYANNKNQKSYSSQPISIEQVVLSCGIMPNLKGFRLICDAISLLLQDEDLLYSVTKLLYPQLAKKHCISAAMVEKAIRHSIENAWNKSENSPIRRLFPINCARPTNSEFLGVLLQVISLELKSHEE